MPPTLAPSCPPNTSRPKLPDDAPKREASGPENRLETRLAAQDGRDSRPGIARDNPAAVYVVDELISEKPTAGPNTHPSAELVESPAHANSWCIPITFFHMTWSASRCESCACCTRADRSRKAATQAAERKRRMSLCPPRFSLFPLRPKQHAKRCLPPGDSSRHSPIPSVGILYIQ